MKLFAGLDVGQDQTAISIVDASGTPLLAAQRNKTEVAEPDQRSASTNASG